MYKERDIDGRYIIILVYFYIIQNALTQQMMGVVVVYGQVVSFQESLFLVKW